VGIVEAFAPIKECCCKNAPGTASAVDGKSVKGKYPRLTASERAQKRASFRLLILKRYHSIVRAWRDFDRNGDGKLSYQEFLRALQKLGYYEGGPRKLFEAMDEDRSGFVSLHEVDPELTAMLSSLAICIQSCLKSSVPIMDVFTTGDSRISSDAVANCWSSSAICIHISPFG